MKNTFKKRDIIYLGIMILMILTAVIVYNKLTSNHKDKVTELKNLNRALEDTIKYKTNNYNEVVAEKYTIQTELKTLEEKNNQLTESQKELLTRLKQSNKENKTFASALVDLRVQLDSIQGSTITNQTDSSLAFTNQTDSISFDLNVYNVKPLTHPYFTLRNLNLPNKQYIDFHWKNNREEGYPIAFSISNSNPLFQTYNIESYTIPSIKKQDLDPNFWDKVNKFTNKSGIKIGIFGAGMLTGFVLAN